MELARLVWRNLMRRKVRTLLTVASLTVAIFLLCLLRTLVTTLASAPETASERRLWVQSAVSLFVDLPVAYEAKIETVDGVADAVKWQWFGGYYKDERNQFAQFAVDAEDTLAIYPEIQIVEGSKEAFLANRRGCVIGEGLARQFDLGLHSTLPLIPTIFPHPDGPGVAWQFEVEAIYRPTQRYFDSRMMLFHWEYFEETNEAGPLPPPGCGTFVVQIEEGADAVAVMAGIDRLFENGPQRVQTTTEAEFNKQFATMFGNVPFFVSTIGGGVLAAILLAVVNTMLMAGREQTHDIGIMKALGFGDGAARGVLIAQSLALCLIGGVLGLIVARLLEPSLAAQIAQVFPGYHVLPQTYALGIGVAVLLGLVAGATPALRAGRMRPVDALHSEE